MEPILHNFMEDLVLRRLDELNDSLNCCKCSKCRLDIASYALNRLPPKYVVTTQGVLLSKLDFVDPQADIKITTAIAEGAIMVNSHPRHVD